MVLYCSIMILLLAFFIVLQAFAEEPQEGMFYAGQGSFRRALSTLGMGQVMARWGRSSATGKPTAPYLAGQRNTQPGSRRIDPELENARQALQNLQQKFGVRKPKGGGWNAVLVTPFSYEEGKESLEEEEERFLREFTRDVLPLLIQRGCVISVGGLFTCPEKKLAPRANAALKAVEKLRTRMLGYLNDAQRKKTEGRIYSFCRRISSKKAKIEFPKGELRIDVFVTRSASPQNESKVRQ
mgnify:CR=1 FL=1